MKTTLCLIVILLVLQADAQKIRQEPLPEMAVQTWTFHHSSFLESVDKADSLGIHALEVYPGQPVGGSIPGVFSYTLDQDARMKLKEYLQYRHMKVVALGVVDKYYYNRKNLEAFFRFCKDMQISYLTAEPEPGDLDLFNRLGAKYQVRVGIHAHPLPGSHYGIPDSIEKAIRNRTWIGAWPDIGHWNRNGADVMAGLKKLAPKLWGMHFKDVNSGGKNAEDTLYGKGVLHTDAVLSYLKQIRFHGVLTMEYESNEWNNMGDMKLNKAYVDEKLPHF